MKNSLIFAKRNILNFFRDKAAIFFSLLSALIIIGLYVLFLGDLIQSGMQDFGDNARFIIDSWIMAGVVSITSITAAMGAFEAMVSDKTSKTLKDFYSAPIKKKEIAAGYILGSFVVGVILCLIALVFAELYIVLYGGSLLSIVSYLKIIGIILLSVLSGSSFMFFLVSFFKTQASFATGSTLTGTLIGFLTGVYIPIGNLPSVIQSVIKIIPVSHSAVLLRQVMMEKAMSGVNIPTQYLNNFNLQMGVNLEVNSATLTPLHSILYLVIAAVVFFILSVIKMSKKSK